MSFHISCRILLPLLLLRGVFSLLSNKTIDDEFGDEVTGLVPNYSPTAGWKGANCDKCFINPRPGRAWSSTYHQATHRPGDPGPRIVNVSFNGSAVYAYCILANTVPSADTITNLTFTLDAQNVGSFVHTPNSSTDYIYGVPVYANNSLPNGPHIFTLETVALVNPSLMLFDYLTYSTESEPAGSTTSTFASSPTAIRASLSRSNRSATIGGAVSGGILFLGIVIYTLFLLRRKRQRIPGVEAFGVEPKERSEARFSLSGRAHRPLSTSEHASLSQAPTSDVATESYDVAASNIGTTGPSSTTRSDREPMTSGARAKRATRQAEVTQQVQEMERTVATLHARRQHSLATRHSSTTTTGSLSPSSETGGDNDAHLLEQIGTLQREVERLQAVERQMMWEMQDIPPPVYTSEGQAGNLGST